MGALPAVAGVAPDPVVVVVVAVHADDRRGRAHRRGRRLTGVVGERGRAPHLARMRGSVRVRSAPAVAHDEHDDDGEEDEEEDDGQEDADDGEQADRVVGGQLGRRGRELLLGGLRERGTRIY